MKRMNISVVEIFKFGLPPILGILLIFLYFLVFHQEDSSTSSSLDKNDQNPTFNQIEKNIIQNICHDEKLDLLVEKLIVLWSGVSADFAEIRVGTDSELRPIYVNLQKVIEQELIYKMTTGEIVNLKGVIHTPAPTTALCTKGNISDLLVDPSLLQDEHRLLSVRSRAQVMRDYLKLDGAMLWVAYTKRGLEKRTKEQRNIYFNELENNPNNLFDCELFTDTIPDRVAGATYIFEDKFGERFAFCIGSTQANDPREMATWGLWFGRLTHPEINNRVKEIFAFLNANGGPDLLSEIPEASFHETYSYTTLFSKFVVALTQFLFCWPYRVFL